MLLANAPQTDDDPIAGGLGFLLIGTLMLIFAFFTRRARWKVLRKKGPRSVRDGLLVQGLGVIAVGLAMLVYGAATR
ncbi:hypothetical protein AB8A21_03140 [Streptomyces sp. BF23-18]|uniref:hypothetical protein n=1 Tax=Streptomyces sp. BF23-18 TaxID=3240282 RepID=UPI0034E58CAB